MEPSTPLCEQIGNALRQSSLPPLRRIVVEQRGDVVVLTGRVQSYYQKQMAQETVLPLLGGRELANRVLVEQPES